MPKRTETVDGLVHVRAVLPEPLPAGGAADVGGVGDRERVGRRTTAGEIHWDDPQLRSRYGLVRAQLQAGRANDLLGVAHAGDARYVLYHPGFTRSGPDGHPNPVVRGVLKTLAVVAARPVARSGAPIVEWIARPPRELLTASDRGKPVDLSGKEADARRLMAYTESLLAR